MNPATLLAAAAIIDARAANGHPEWKRIADELAAAAAEVVELVPDHDDDQAVQP